MSVFLLCCWSATSCPPQGNSFRVLQHEAERNSAGHPPPPPSCRTAGSCLASSAEICCRTWNRVFTVFKFTNFVPFFPSLCTFISFPQPLKQYITLTVAIDRRSMSLFSSNLAKFVSYLYPLCTFISFPPELKQFVTSNLYSSDDSSENTATICTSSLNENCCRTDTTCIVINRLCYVYVRACVCTREHCSEP